MTEFRLAPNDGVARTISTDIGRKSSAGLLECENGDLVVTDMNILSMEGTGGGGIRASGIKSPHEKRYSTSIDLIG